jgi:hypothetical protein
MSLFLTLLLLRNRVLVGLQPNIGLGLRTSAIHFSGEKVVDAESETLLWLMNLDWPIQNHEAGSCSTLN